MANHRVVNFCLWNDSVLYIGDSFDPVMHSHNAVQCCIATRGQMRVRSSSVDDWSACSAVVIGANVKHCIRNPEGPLCLIYLENASDGFQKILQYQRHNRADCYQDTPMIVSQEPDELLQRQLAESTKKTLAINEANTLKRACLHFLQGQLPKTTQLNESLSKVLRHIHAHPQKNFTGRALANVASLSESRLQHLFKAQLGIPIRRYVQWMRLRHVIALAVSGITLTEAAHAAGFSDSSHFSRVFKAMFGIAPSTLLNTGTQLRPLFCD